MRFLLRSQQLTRLQTFILERMIADTAAEQSALPTKIESTEDVKALIALVTPGLARSAERIADIPLALQLFLARHVDNFQSFLEELLRLILRSVPGLLKRGESISIEEVLSFRDIAEVIEAVIERKLHGWAYKSIRDLDETVFELTRFRLFPKELSAVERLYDDRNLFTHNYGLVNAMYLRKHSDCGSQIGEPLKLDIKDLQAAWELLNRVGVDIESRARAKFKLASEA
jgi:hypothetical protein